MYVERLRLGIWLYEDLVGKPFARGGRGPEVFDCLGLAAEITRRRGVEVPEYEDAVQAYALACDEDRGCVGRCLRVDAPRAGCVVLLRSPGEVSRHLGIMLDPYRMIHASEDAGGVVIEVLRRSAWARRVLGFYYAEPEVDA